MFLSKHNVLLLDEPTNYLDMPSILALQQMIKEYEGTVILVSYDEEFVNAIAEEVLIIEDKKIHSFTGNLKEYRVYKKERETRDLRREKKS